MFILQVLKYEAQGDRVYIRYLGCRGQYEWIDLAAGRLDSCRILDYIW